MSEPKGSIRWLLCGLGMLLFLIFLSTCSEIVHTLKVDTSGDRLEIVHFVGGG